MNSEKIKTSDPQRVLLNLSDKINLQRKDKFFPLSNFNIYYTWKNIKKSYKNNEFKISALTPNQEIELADGLNSVSNIQDYFKYILQKYETVTDNPSIMIYANIIKNRIIFKIKTGHYLELLNIETMKLLGRTKIKINKDENGENVSHLEINKVVLIHCNIVNNDYQQSSIFLRRFIPNKLFGRLLDNWPKKLYFKNFLIQNFHILKYGLLIKILNR